MSLQDVGFGELLDEEAVAPKRDCDELDAPVERHRNTYNVSLRFGEPGYIAEPYWPERNTVINITKKSGTDRCKTEATKAAAITAYLDREGITQTDYDRLVRLASRAWYRINDDLDTGQSTEIVIPRHQIMGCLVESTKRSPAAVVKTSLAENLRTILQVSELRTGKHEQDVVFSRYVRNDITNQRRLHVSEVIVNFYAAGTIAFDPNEITPKTVLTLLRWGLANIGVGAARKMGYGRAEVSMTVRV